MITSSDKRKRKAADGSYDGRIVPVLLIGAGRMGSALIGRWHGDDAERLSLVVIEPVAERREFLRQRHPGIDIYLSVAESPAANGWVPRVVVVAVKPQDLSRALQECVHLAGGPSIFVSVAAGQRISSMETILGNQTAIARAMPNVPAAIGRGMTACIGNTSLAPCQSDEVESLFRRAGEVCWLRHEDQMNAVTAVSGSGPAYVYHFIEAFARAAAQIGLDEGLAMQLVGTTVVGAAAMLEQHGADAATLCGDVTSPGGTTEAGLGVLQADDGLEHLLFLTVLAAWSRSIELSDKHVEAQA